MDELETVKRKRPMVKLTKQQKAIVRSVNEFVKGEFDKERILELDQTGRFPEDIWKSAAALGFLGIHLPEDVGGGSMEMVDHMLIAEAFSRHDATLGAALMMAGVGAEWISGFAPEALKQEILPGLLEGKILPGCALSQPGGGVGLSESEDKGFFVVDGDADHVINGGNADIYLIPLKAPESGFVMIHAADKGIFIEKQYQPLGLRMTGCAKIKISGVAVPKAHCIFLKKKSRASLIAPIRMLMAFLALGTARGAMDRALAHIKERKQFGVKIAKFQVLRHKLAVMAIQMNQARSLTYMAALTYSPQKPDTARVAMACAASMSAATWITHEAIQLMGGYGYTVEYEVERFCRDAKTLQMMSQGSFSLYDDIADAAIGTV